MTSNSTETGMKLFTYTAINAGEKRRDKSVKKFYARELRRLQQEWIKKNGLKVVVVFEERDAAGKWGHQTDYRKS